MKDLVPRVAVDSLGVLAVAAEAAVVDRRGLVVRAARPPHVRLVGPLGGRADVDSVRLRAEGVRMVEAADLLAEAEQRFAVKGAT